MGHTIHHYYFRIAPRPAGPVRIARLGPGGPSPRAALRLALRPRDGLRRAPLPARDLVGDFLAGHDAAVGAPDDVEGGPLDLAPECRHAVLDHGDPVLT